MHRFHSRRHSLSNAARTIAAASLVALSLVLNPAPSELFAQSAPEITYTPASEYGANKPMSDLSPTNTGGAVPGGVFRNVTNYAGSGTSDYLDNADPLAARFNQPWSVEVDRHGHLFVGEYNGKNLRRVDVSTGAVSSICRSSENSDQLTGIAVHPTWGHLYYTLNDGGLYKFTNSDSVNYAGGLNLAGTYDGSGSGATCSNTSVAGITRLTTGLDAPRDMVIHPNGSYILVATTGSGDDKIVEVDLSTNQQSTFAGTGSEGDVLGSVTSARFKNPEGVAFSLTGDTVYVSDFGNHKVKQITGGTVSLLAGSTAGTVDDIGSSAKLEELRHLAVGPDGSIYVGMDHSIRKITKDGRVSTFAGPVSPVASGSGTTNGVGDAARFNRPAGVAIDAARGVMYVAEINNHRIRKIEMSGYTVQPSLPSGLSLNTSTGTISGTPTQTTFKPFYVNDFNDGSLTANGVTATKGGSSQSAGPITTNGQLEMNGDADNTWGYLSIPEGGDRTSRYRIEFDVIQENGESYGFSYSLTDDSCTASPGATNDNGCGDDLEIYFTTNGNTIQANWANVSLASTTSGVDGYFKGRTARVAITLDSVSATQGRLDLTIDGTSVFSNATLPSTYLSANKSDSGWQHLLRSHTGTSDIATYFDNLSIQKGLSTTGDVGGFVVTAYNAFGSDSTIVALKVEAGLDVTTVDPDQATITETTGTTGGAVSANGLTVQRYGVCFLELGADPTGVYADSTALMAEVNSGAGAECFLASAGTSASFTKAHTDLTMDSTYAYRAFATATISNTVYWGDEAGLMTLPAVPPTVTTTAAASLTATSAILGGNVIKQTAPIRQTGFVYSTSPDPTVTSYSGGGLYVNHPIIDTLRTGILSPGSISVDASGNVYVPSYYSYKVFKITPSGTITEFPVNVPGPLASAISRDGRYLYVPEFGSGRIHRIKLSDGSSQVVSEYSRVRSVLGMDVGPDGTLYLADYWGNAIYSLSSACVLADTPTPSNCILTLFAGNGGTDFSTGAAATAGLPKLNDVAVDNDGNVYAALDVDHRIVRISGGQVSVYAGDGTPRTMDGQGTSASFFQPRSVTWDSTTNSLYVMELRKGLRKIDSNQYVSSIQLTYPNGAPYVNETYGNYEISPVASYVPMYLSGYVMKVDDRIDGSFTSTVTGLTAETTYYVRAYAVTDLDGVVYGSAESFTTPGVPKVTTEAATNIASATATLNGTITDIGAGNVTTYGFVYRAGTDTSLTLGASGITADSLSGQTISSSQLISRNLSGLTLGTTYFARAFTRNSEGVGYGETIAFTTTPMPTVTTTLAIGVGSVSAVLGGDVINSGNGDSDATVLTARGVVYGTEPSPTVDAQVQGGKTVHAVAQSMDAYSDTLSGLAPSTTYYYRAYATNNLPGGGTAYGEEYTLRTLKASSSDSDSRVHYRFESSLADEFANSTLTLAGSCSDSPMPDPCNLITGFDYDAAQNDDGYWTWTSTNPRGGGFTITTDDSIGVTYTMRLKFSFSEVSPSRQIIDYKDRQSNFGLQLFYGKIFIPYTGNTKVRTSPDQVVDMIAVRKQGDLTASPAAADSFLVYTVNNGNLTKGMAVADPKGYTIPTGNGAGGSKLGFFFDDLLTEDGASPSGRVYDLQIWFDRALSEPEIYMELFRTVFTEPAFAITQTLAVSGGRIDPRTLLEGQSLAERGIVYGTSRDPRLGGAGVTKRDAAGTSPLSNTSTSAETFTFPLLGLTPNTTYYVHSFAVRQAGVVRIDTLYGDEVSFTTSLAATPTVVTSEVTANITTTGADLSGDVTAQGGSSVFERGFVYRVEPENAPGSLQDATEGFELGLSGVIRLADNASGTGPFTETVNGLTATTTYQVRAYAKNNAGTAYGEVVTFTTEGAPSVNTTAADSITSTFARLAGQAVTEGASGATISRRGVQLSKDASFFTLEDSVKDATGGTGAFSGATPALTPNTTYYYRAYADNSAAAKGKGQIRSFRTGVAGVDVKGSAGFRMMSAPKAGAGVLSTLLDPLWTQGMSGGADVAGGSANVWTYDGSEWVTLSDLGTTYTAGRGFLVYAYEDADNTGGDNDLAGGGVRVSVASHAAAENAVDVVVSGLTYSADQTANLAGSGWQLLGNPYSLPIDADQLGLDSGVNSDWNSVVYIYDDAYGWRSWTASANGGSGALENGYIAPYQAFFVQGKSGSATSFTFPQSAKVFEQATFRKEIARGKSVAGDGCSDLEGMAGSTAADAASTAPAAGTAAQPCLPAGASLRLRMETLASQVNAAVTEEKLLLDQTFLSFHEGAEVGRDAFDAFKMSPLDSRDRVAGLWYVDGVAMDNMALPMQSSANLRVPLDVVALTPDRTDGQPASGVYRMAPAKVSLFWELDGLDKAGLKVTLIDKVTGRELALERDGGYSFTAQEGMYPALEGSMVMPARNVSRFEVVVTYKGVATSNEVYMGQELPKNVSLSQNYPNPFNPTTQIRFALPKATSGVSLQVYDLLGRRVATLLKGAQMTAGWHEVRFDATGLASGVYLYRLTTPGATQTRQFTLIK